MIRTVIFDIDNTLYSYDDAHKVAFAALLEYAEKNLHMTAAVQFEKLIRLKLLSYIDFMVCSEEAGAECRNAGSMVQTPGKRSGTEHTSNQGYEKIDFFFIIINLKKVLI